MKKLRFLLFFSPVIVLILYLRTMFILVVVTGGSMAPTYRDGQALIFTKDTKDINVGDIVIYEYNDKIYVKRVVIFPGDTYFFFDQRDDQYFYPSKEILLPSPKKANSHSLRAVNATEMTLMHDELFVEGDAGNFSLDSKKYGPIKRDEVLGKLIYPWKDCEECWWNIPKPK